MYFSLILILVLKYILPRIITTLEINATIERTFDLSRRIGFHAYTQSNRYERLLVLEH